MVMLFMHIHNTVFFKGLSGFDIQSQGECCYLVVTVSHYLILIIKVQ